MLDDPVTEIASMGTVFPVVSLVKYLLFDPPTVMTELVPSPFTLVTVLP